jgi:succinate-semialdehyde dehydrogenase/glutarate-semialdehyde dehydrogenase
MLGGGGANGAAATLGARYSRCGRANVVAMPEFRSFDPRDGAWRTDRPDATDAGLDAALAACAAAFDPWRRQSFAQRGEVLLRLADVLEQRSGELAALMAQEMGKPVTQGIGEARKCAWACRHAAGNAAAWLADEPVATEARTSFVAHEPLGVILAVMPWNFPLWQLFRFGASALAAGNVILLKHAPCVPRCAEAIVSVFADAHAPAGLLENVFARVDQIERLIADPRTAGVTLTGSTRAGRAIAALAGRHLKPSVLELGGSDPFIVLRDADVERAATTAAAARLQNNGQSCIASKRFIVHAAVADAFVERFRSHLAAAVVGDPCDATTTLGPMARRDLRDDLHAQVQASVARGARLVLGGQVPDNDGFWYPPTLLLDVNDGMPAWDAETFGPVAAVRVVADIDEAIRIANATPYALGASVWTDDRDEGLRVARALRGGAAFVNAMVKSDPRLPFGGNAASGWGRELGREGMRAFTAPRSFWIE